MIDEQEYNQKPMQLYRVPKPIKLAIFFGIVKEAFTCEDYLIEASITESGYETVSLWALQGAGKSTRMLQMMYWIIRFLFIVNNKRVDLEKYGCTIVDNKIDYGKNDNNLLSLIEATHEYWTDPEEEKEIWLKVLDLVVFKPSTFVETLEELEDDEVLPVLGWDDVGVHYPATKFKTDIKQYEAIDSTWAAIRTKVHVILTTIPLIDRLAKNLRDNVTLEVFLGKNQMEIINRCYHLPGIKRMESNFFKVTIEKPAPFDLFMVPQWVWDIYWKKRLKLTKEALQNLRKATNMESIEGYITVIDAAEIAFTERVKYSASTIQQDISRGIIEGQKINGILCVSEDGFRKIMRQKKGWDDIPKTEE